MGSRARKIRLEKLRQEHPFCYFCAEGRTEEEDHVPSRECFRGRQWPEGYAFPACSRCNRAASQIEQGVALYLMLANHDPEDPHPEQLQKLVKGVANNNPELLPKVTVRANDARRHFKSRGMRLAPGQSYADTPLLELPPANRDALLLFSRRLTCAIYYKEIGRPIPLDWNIATVWTPVSDPVAFDLASKANEMFPDLRITTRRNTSLGEQFVYRWGCQEDGSIFGFAAQFSKSFIFMGATAAPEFSSSQVSEAWRPHLSDLSLMDEFVAAKNNRLRE